jgi:hypothetical protein
MADISLAEIALHYGAVNTFAVAFLLAKEYSTGSEEWFRDGCAKYYDLFFDEKNQLGALGISTVLSYLV